MNYIISNNGVVCAVVGGNSYTFDKGHQNYNSLLTYLKNGNVEHFEASYDIASTVEHYCEGYVHVEGGNLTWQGVPMPELFTERILKMRQEGFNIDPMLNFLNNMNDNPSDKAIVELFDFMEHQHLPITDDGHFLAYKAVDKDFKDLYSGSFDNSVGSDVSVDRGSVDSNRDKGCSHGLHVGSIDYVSGYGNVDIKNMSDEGGGDNSDGGNQIVICKVNPRDVVSVPTCSRFQKLRCCQYEVVSLFNDIFETSVHVTDAGLKKVARTEEWKHEIAAKLENVMEVLSRAEVCAAL
jgi:hypothetical protein